MLLDDTMDRDHHRSVLTFAGAPEAVAEAAFQAVKVAASLIDLRHHHGVHPRVGATDVVPFVPVRDVMMSECVALARHLGARIGGELGIPVFLYERAASRPDRAPLEAVRRGGLSGLAERMKHSAWHPDYGPSTLHETAGATVVGARPPLIAFNVNLDTEDIDVARAIAKRIRASSGGLPSVKAIGVSLASRRLTQVSMNLTNYEETPVQVAFEAVRRETERQGVAIAESELVGLIPEAALAGTSPQAIHLAGFTPSQILEVRLAQALRKSE